MATFLMNARDMGITLPAPVLMKFSSDQASLTMTPQLQPRFLVVERSRMRAYAAKAVFEARGICVRLCFDGIQAVKLLERETFDAVFMDIELPLMSGIEATARIRAAEARSKGRNKRMLVFGTVGESLHTPECIAFCRDCGMDRYILKPLVLHTSMFCSMFSNGGLQLDRFRSTARTNRWVSRYDELRTLLTTSQPLGAPEFAHFVHDEEVRRQLEMIASFGDDGSERAELLKYYTRQKVEDMLCLRYKHDLLQRELWETKQRSKDNAVTLVGAKMMRNLVRPGQGAKKNSTPAVRQELEAQHKNVASLSAELQQVRGDMRNLIATGALTNERREKQHKRRLRWLTAHNANLETAVMAFEDIRSMNDNHNYVANLNLRLAQSSPDSPRTCGKTLRNAHPCFDTLNNSYFRHELMSVSLLFDKLATRRLTQEKRGLDSLLSSLISNRRDFPEDVLCRVVTEIKRCLTEEAGKQKAFVEKVKAEADLVALQFLRRELDIWGRQPLGADEIALRSHLNFPEDTAAQTDPPPPERARPAPVFQTQPLESSPQELLQLQEALDDLRAQTAESEQRTNEYTSRILTTLPPLLEEVSDMSDAVFIPSLEVEEDSPGDAGAVLGKCEEVLNALVFSLKQSLADASSAAERVQDLEARLEEAEGRAEAAQAALTLQQDSTTLTADASPEAAAQRPRAEGGSKRPSNMPASLGAAAGQRRAASGRSDAPPAGGAGGAARGGRLSRAPPRSEAQRQQQRQQEGGSSPKPPAAQPDGGGGGEAAGSPAPAPPLDPQQGGAGRGAPPRQQAPPPGGVTQQAQQPPAGGGKPQQQQGARGRFAPAAGGQQGATGGGAAVAGASEHAGEAQLPLGGTPHHHHHQAQPQRGGAPAPSGAAADAPRPTPHPAPEQQQQQQQNHHHQQHQGPAAPLGEPGEPVPPGGMPDPAHHRGSGVGGGSGGEVGPPPTQSGSWSAEGAEGGEGTGGDGAEGGGSDGEAQAQPAQGAAGGSRGSGGRRIASPAQPARRPFATSSATLEFSGEGGGSASREGTPADARHPSPATKARDIKAFFRKHTKALEGPGGVGVVVEGGRLESLVSVPSICSGSPSSNASTLCLTGLGRGDTPAAPERPVRGSDERRADWAEKFAPGGGGGGAGGGGVLAAREGEAEGHEGLRVDSRAHEELRHIQGYLYPKPPSSGKGGK